MSGQRAGAPANTQQAPWREADRAPPARRRGALAAAVTSPVCGTNPRRAPPGVFS
jgi:hypothetical protein